ncbi:cell division protein ZapA [Erythrobacter sp. SD-21]|uniref:cell division protein ZapA n=1 Tax=Erythrobacter sp. SD-21 TaxID=161528 RepID=UPI000153F4F0|nr:cell division protein ZapA [Erythrobacter sp. SD-21]EDL48015.1 hypothetical protein ED21_29251 [Erythrobacter sp. SD-21]
MSDVKLKVGGRQYTVACADGQEDSVRRLAGVVDEKLTQMGANLSGNEAKNLLFASLLLADELDEARKKASAPPPPSPAPASPAIDTDCVADKLERLALALENAASRLESGPEAS